MTKTMSFMSSFNLEDYKYMFCSDSGVHFYDLDIILMFLTFIEVIHMNLQPRSL